MAGSTAHLAQFNIARMVAPLDSEQLVGFVDGLDPINRLAEQSPGFVWRLQSEEGDATSFRISADDRWLVNLSVWESVESLRNYAYDSRHREFLRRRREWFEKPSEPHLVVWWIEPGHEPTLEESMERLERLRALGPTPEAFTLRRVFEPA